MKKSVSEEFVADNEEQDFSNEVKEISKPQGFTAMLYVQSGFWKNLRRFLRNRRKK